MQTIIHARIGMREGGKGKGKSSRSSAIAMPPPLPLIEHLLTFSPHVLYMQPNIYFQCARLLASHGLLVHTCDKQQAVTILVPQHMCNEKGGRTILTWIAPLLPKPPTPTPIRGASGRDGGSSTSKSRKDDNTNGNGARSVGGGVSRRVVGAAPTSWKCILRPVDRDAMIDSDESDSNSSSKPRWKMQSVEVGQPDGWEMEVGIASNHMEVGVADCILQQCICYIVGLELNRQGWCLVNGRWVRYTFTASIVPAVGLSSVVSNQSEVTTLCNVSQVRYNVCASKAECVEQVHCNEMTVKVLPDLENALVLGAIGIATPNKSFGVDREAWQLKHGLVLPSTFPVVQLKIGGEDCHDSFHNATLTYPLPACLITGLHTSHLHSRDEAAKMKRQQENEATLKEILTILKAVRVIPIEHEPTSSNALVPLFTDVEQESVEESDLLTAINPHQKTSSITSSSSADIPLSFQRASELTPSSNQTSSRQGRGQGQHKGRVQLTIPQRRPHRPDFIPTDLSLIAIRAATQLPQATPATGMMSGMTTMRSSGATSTLGGWGEGMKRMAAETKNPRPATSSAKRKSTSMSGGSSSSMPPSKRISAAPMPSTTPTSSAAPRRSKEAASIAQTQSSAQSTANSKKDSTKTKIKEKENKEKSKSKSKSTSKLKGMSADWSVAFEAAFANELTKQPTKSAATDTSAAFRAAASGSTTATAAPAAAPPSTAASFSTTKIKNSAYIMQMTPQQLQSMDKKQAATTMAAQGKAASSSSTKKKPKKSTQRRMDEFI